jgi:mycofactocin glycosyltransferase
MTTLVLDVSARRLEAGRVLAGGHPPRLLRLTATGARLVDEWQAGAEIDAGRVLADRLIAAGLAHPRPTPGAVSPADVAIVIPTRNRLPDLTAIGPCREIVIVDDGSTPSLKVPGTFRLVRRDVSGGPAAARNTGLAATDAPFVAFVDSDVTPTGGWLEPLLAHFADPRLAAIAPRVRVPAGDSALARYEAARSPLDLGPHPGLVGPGRRVGYVPAAALVVRRAALAAPFDEGLRFGEDVDLVWRLVGAGWTVRYEPASVVEHPHRGSLAAWLAQRAAYGSSAGPLARRHPGRMRHLIVPRGLAKRPDPALRELTQQARVSVAKGVADAVWRAYAPALLVSRPGRRVLAAALVAGAAADFRQRRPPLDPVRFTALRAADDLAYAAGVWAGCIRARTAAPLVPASKYPKLDHE